LEFIMSTRRVLGIVLLVVGVILLIVGMNSSESVADQVSETFTGRFTKASMWFIVGGSASSLLGLLLVVVGNRGKTG
jgi:hypothetical protein